MSAFDPVKTLEDLDSLDEREMELGYRSAESGDPEPGPNRGRSFWHGWCCRMMDRGEIAVDDDHRELIRAWLARERERQKGGVAEGFENSPIGMEPKCP